MARATKRSNRLMMVYFLFFKYDRRSAGCDHQHAPVLAYRFVIQIDTDHGIRTHLGGLFLHFLQCTVFGPAQHFLVGAGSASHNVAYAGKQVPENVGADYGFTRDDAPIRAIFCPSMEGVVVKIMVFELVCILQDGIDTKLLQEKCKSFYRLRR